MTSDFLRVPLHSLPAESGCVIDCDTCTVRGAACADCVVSVMLGGPPGALPIEPDEHRALAVLAGAGLVPPLQMTPGAPSPPAADGATAPPAAGGAPTPPAVTDGPAPARSTTTPAPRATTPAPRAAAPGRGARPGQGPSGPAPGRPGPGRDDERP